MSIKENRAIACFLGNALGDALGAHTEFLELNPQRIIIAGGWLELEEYCKNLRSQQRTEFGVITDDCSMARCLADSLLANDIYKFNPIDLRIRFLLWWHFGYNNSSKNNYSFGLGGNIAESFDQFYSEQNEFCDEIQGQNNGNGSIMRLGPVPIAFYDNLEQALQVAELQSYTTHNGKEAAECCKLLTFLNVKLINYEGKNAKSDIFDLEIKNFQSRVQSVNSLKNSEQEPEENMKLYNKKFNHSALDRNWDWKSPNFMPSPWRKKINNTYYGSYCMDAMYAALHIIYNTDSFQKAIFKAVNLGGDSDSIAAVVGQIAGCMYGLNTEVMKLYKDRMLKFDRFSTFVKARKLFLKKSISTKLKYNKR